MSPEATVHNFAPPLVDDGGGWRQFVTSVDAICPVDTVVPSARAQSVLPCVIWVQTAGEANCGETEYTVHLECVRLLEDATGMRKAYARNWVCGHQGRFLE